MYQIKCDGYILDDPRDKKLIVHQPRLNLEVNTVGGASFYIFSEHPYYGHLKKLRSIFEILQDGETIFRGRMTEDTNDFDNTKAVDLEGALAFFNDSMVRPFAFPGDFLSDAEYITASENGNVVEFFVKWLIDNHNSQVQEFQRLELGRVTVKDPNNYLSRSSTEHLKTWEVFKQKLFDSALGGYLCIRYEENGNYVDYLEDFESINTQIIEYGENLLDLTSNSDASETYTAILPLGMKKNEIDKESTDDSRLTISDLADGEITSDLVKSGDIIYSKSGVEKYGFIIAPVSESTWEDVSSATNLQAKSVDYMQKTALKLISTITVKGVDLHFSDDEIESFRIYKYVSLHSKPHNQENDLKLSKLDIDIHDPQNTIITMGDTQLSMTDINAGTKKDVEEKVNSAKSDSASQTEKLVNSIKFKADGSLGEKATITFTINGRNFKTEIDLTAIRQAFADDESDIAIESGSVTFKDGTLAVNGALSGYNTDEENKADLVGVNANDEVEVGDENFPTVIKGESIYIPTLIQTGSDSITPEEADVITSKTISFKKAFQGIPKVFITPFAAVTGIGVSNVDSAGFTVWLTQSDTTETNFNWLAVYEPEYAAEVE